MKSLRFWIIILIIWLIFFFNVERINSPVNIRSYTYIFVAVVVALILALPKLQKLPFLMWLTVPIPVFLGLKALMEKGHWYENLLVGYALPLTVTQVSAIILTSLLARQIIYSLHEFEEVIAKITFGHVGKLPKPFSDGQRTMYKEVKRARRYHRPLAVIAFKISESDFQVILPKMVQEVQQAMMREFVMAGIARILDANMHDFDTIAVRDNHFILVLPEIPAEEAAHIAQKLEDAIADQMQIKLQVGTATFPKEAMTFESLVDLALDNAQKSAEVVAIPKQVKRQNLGDVRL